METFEHLTGFCGPVQKLHSVSLQSVASVYIALTDTAVVH